MTLGSKAEEAKCRSKGRPADLDEVAQNQRLVARTGWLLRCHEQRVQLLQGFPGNFRLAAADCFMRGYLPTTRSSELKLLAHWAGYFELNVCTFHKLRDLPLGRFNDVSRQVAEGKA